jgi:hypothetical protein
MLLLLHWDQLRLGNLQLCGHAACRPKTAFNGDIGSWVLGALGPRFKFQIPKKAQH